MADLSRAGLPAKANPIADGNRPPGLPERPAEKGCDRARYRFDQKPNAKVCGDPGGRDRRIANRGKRFREVLVPAELFEHGSLC